MKINTEGLPDNVQIIQLAYAGQRIDKDGKLTWQWHLVVNNVPQEPRIWDKAVIKYASPGQVYTMPAILQPDGRISPFAGRAVYAGLLADDEVRRDWQAAHMMCVTRHGMIAKAKKETGQDIFATLDTVRDILRKQVGTNRRVMIGLIVDYLLR
jgi:hypothetical protein